MINRGLTKTSAYVFNAKTGMLEKVDDKVKTIESLADKKDSITSLDDIAKKVNKKDKKEPINNITVITADDNLIHNYFTSMDISWDASNCLSSAIIKMPKMNVENTHYWSTYTGQLTIYAGYNFTFDYVNNNSHSTENDAAASLTKYWDNSDIKPFFRGEISRVKEYEEDITLYVDSIGRRFQQKIPDEFRQSFINNQNVRDAFQAICEFLGVFYICPPTTVTDNGEEELTDETTTTDGTENDVSKQQGTINKIKQQAKNKIQQAQSTANTGNSTSTDPNNPNATNNENGQNTEDALTNNEEIDDVQNGYGDINFDANGAIVHGSAAIETSPDMAETLVAMEENPLEQYLEDETGIVEAVQKLLKGEMFDELHNKVMDYGAITIQPKSTSTTDMSAANTTTNPNDPNNPNATNTNDPNNPNATTNTGTNTGTNTSTTNG